MDQTTYNCAECGFPIIIIEGQFLRQCGHLDAPVLANLTAVAYGTSDMNRAEEND